MEQATESKLPVHVGVIMDGNGRWAKQRHQPRIFGHRKGADTFGKIARHAAKVGVRYLTVYAFSTENWSRPQDEVDGIMNLLRSYLSDSERYAKENMRMRVLGEREGLAPDLVEKIRSIEERSKNHTGMALNIALNYGGRSEVLRGAKALAQRYRDGQIADLEQVDEAAFGALLDTEEQPDVDLIIRTSGEYRISNFLLWQGAYAEYVFTDTLWPDFSSRDFDDALAEYAKRQRRMGGI